MSQCVRHTLVGLTKRFPPIPYNFHDLFVKALSCFGMSKFATKWLTYKISQVYYSPVATRQNLNLSNALLHNISSIAECPAHSEIDFRPPATGTYYPPLRVSAVAIPLWRPASVHKDRTVRCFRRISLRSSSPSCYQNKPGLSCLMSCLSSIPRVRFWSRHLSAKTGERHKSAYFVVVDGVLQKFFVPKNRTTYQYRVRQPSTIPLVRGG